MGDDAEFPCQKANEKSKPARRSTTRSTPWLRKIKPAMANSSALPLNYHLPTAGVLATEKRTCQTSIAPWQLLLREQSGLHLQNPGQRRGARPDDAGKISVMQVNAHPRHVVVASLENIFSKVDNARTGSYASKNRV